MAFRFKMEMVVWANLNVHLLSVFKPLILNPCFLYLLNVIMVIHNESIRKILHIFVGKYYYSWSNQ